MPTIHRTASIFSSRYSFGRRELSLPTTSQSDVGESVETFHTYAEETFGQKLKRFFYDKERHTCCNRTLRDWATMIVFYIGFLIVLFCLFFGLTYGFLYFIKKYRKPAVTKNLISLGPALSFIPNIAHSDSPLIWFSNSRTHNTKSFMESQAYVDYIENYFSKYREAQDDRNYRDCSQNRDKDSMCFFNISTLGPCAYPNYGYDENKPCIYLKLNNLRNWKPQHYDVLPKDMPNSLQRLATRTNTKKSIWVHCEGVHPHDKEHLGTISYYPYQGFPETYFPYSDSYSFIQPIVAVQLTHIKPGYVINMVCTPWAKNIENYNNEKSVQIQLYIHLA